MKRYKNNSVLYIPDTHAPYHHPDTIPFLKGVRDKYQPDRVFHLGDITDSYCFTRFPKDIENPDSYTTEYRGVRRFVSDLTDIFPEGTLIKGNHDARLWERAKQSGIPRGLLIPFETIIGLDKTDWKTAWDYTFTVDATRSQWYVTHTKAGSAMALAKQLGVSVAFGHEHTKFSIDSFQHLEKRVYGVQGGCLLGNNRYAFAYNRQSMVRPNLGCVIVDRGVPRLIPMDCGPNGKWNRIVH